MQLETSASARERDLIVAAVEDLFAEQVAFLEQLVRFRSLRNEERAIQDFVAGELERRGFDVRRIRTDDSRISHHPAFSPATVDYADSWNIVGLKPSTGGGRSLAFNSHVDVVPAGSAHRWRTPPFIPLRDGDWLYGRGAGDMKAGLSASIFALDAITRAGLRLTGNVQVQSVVEEEITGNGAATLFDQGFTADAVLSPEPTDEELVRANAGVIKFRLATRGRPAHPREPGRGRSAIELMMKLIVRLRDLERQWIAEGKSRRYFEHMTNPVALTIGTISGGDWNASIPSDCVVEGRIGFFPGDDPRDRAAAFESFLKRVEADDPDFAGERLVGLEWIGAVHAGYTLPEGGAAESCLRHAHASIGGGRDLRATVMACYLDAAIFAVHGRIQALVYGPVAENIHGIDERVSLASLQRVTKVLALFAANWCGTERS
jgi:acetylornithine deacetylase